MKGEYRNDYNPDDDSYTICNNTGEHLRIFREDIPELFKGVVDLVVVGGKGIIVRIDIDDVKELIEKAIREAVDIHADQPPVTILIPLEQLFAAFENYIVMGIERPEIYMPEVVNAAAELIRSMPALVQAHGGPLAEHFKGK